MDFDIVAILMYATAAVTACSAIAAVTPTPKDDAAVALKNEKGGNGSLRSELSRMSQQLIDKEEEVRQLEGIPLVSRRICIKQESSQSSLEINLKSPKHFRSLCRTFELSSKTWLRQISI